MKRYFFVIFLIISFGSLFPQIQVTQAVRVFGVTGTPSEPFLIVQPNQNPFFWLLDTGFNTLGSFSLPLPSDVYYFDILGLSSDFDADPNLEVLYYVYDTFVNVHSYIVLRDIFDGLNQLEFNANDSFYTGWTTYFGTERIFVVSDGNTEILYRSGVDVFVEEENRNISGFEGNMMRLSGSINPVFIEFEMPSSGLASFKIFDVSGRLVKSIKEEYYGAGSHTIYFDPTDGRGNPLPQGRYSFLLEIEGQRVNESVLFIK